MTIQYSKDTLVNFFIFFFYFCLLIWFSPNLAFYLNSPDQGYQISAGKLILLGDIPFRDLLFTYGPLVPYTSAFGQWISNSLIGETIICSIGYALSLFLIYFLVTKHSSKGIGLLSSVLGFLLLARFYKWYYWLFSLLALLCIYYILNFKDSIKVKWLYFGGIICGIAGLYRLDLGVGLFFLFTIMILFSSVNKKKFKISSLKFIISELGTYTLFFLIPFIIWAIFLVINGASFLDYLRITYDGATGNIQYWSSPIPSFELENVFSYPSCVALAFRLVPISLVAILMYSLWNIFKNSDPNNQKYIFLMLSCISGLLLFPQAIHRADYGHLLQVMPPVIIAVSIFLSGFFNFIYYSKMNFKKIFFVLFILSYIILILLIGMGISLTGNQLGGGDLVKFELNPLPRLHQLSIGINPNEENLRIEVINIVQNNTKISDKILIIPPQHQLYYFINRPMSGMILWYGPGMHDNEYWRNKNFESILHDPPKIIIIKDNFTDGFTNYRFNEYQLELYNYILDNYTTTLYEKQGWQILKKS